MRALLLLLLSPLTLQASDPDPATVLTAIEKAAAYYYEELSVEGGYASSWDRITGIGFTEHNESSDLISIQPHGTTTMGLALVRAYEATGSEILLRFATEAALCLTKCQLSSGGWPSDFDFHPERAKRYHRRIDQLDGDMQKGKRIDVSTLDDNKTQSALRFLLEYSRTAGVETPASVEASLRFGLGRLMEIQASNGGFPQQYSNETRSTVPPELKASIPDEYRRDWPKEKYSRYLTLNDDNLLHITSLFLRAAEIKSDDSYLEAAQRCGNFLLLAQLPEPHPGWAQQYDDSMQPVWARKFEPPAVSSIETMGALETLYELWIATGDQKFLEPFPAALNWLSNSRLDNGKWARFYELGTNKPLYCDADDYSLTYSDENLPSHYGFQIAESFARKIDRMRKDLERPRENVVLSRSGEKGKEARSLAGKVKIALETQDKDGYWINEGKIDAKRYVTHLNTMSDYYKALTKSQH